MHKLPYLAGLIDGEGWIGIGINKRKGKSNQYYPRYSITNTNKALIDSVCSMLDELGCGYHVSVHTPTNPEHKTRYVIDVAGFKRVFKLLNKVEPYLIGKKSQAQIVLAFLLSRMQTDNIRAPYSDDEVNCYLALRELNNKGTKILNEYTPKAAEFAAMMYSGLRSKDGEEAEMTSRLDRYSRS